MCTIIVVKWKSNVYKEAERKAIIITAIACILLAGSASGIIADVFGSVQDIATRSATRSPASGPADEPQALQPLIQPLGDGSVILYDRITTWVSSPKYRTPEQPEPPAEKPQPAKGQQKKGDQAPDTKGEPKTPAEPEPVLDKRAPLKRVGLLLGCAYVTAVSDYTTYATAAAALGWVVAAYMVGTPDEPPTKAAHGAPAAAPETPRDAIVQWLTEAIGDRPGIHLYELYPKMLALPGMQAHDEPALREALVALDIPITRAFTVGDVRGRSEVRLADLVAPLPSREEHPLSKGEDAGETASSTTEERPESAPSSGEEPTPAA